MTYEGEGDTNCNWCAQNDPQKLGKGAGGVRNLRTCLDHPDCSIFEIGQNTERVLEACGDLLSLRLK